MCIRAYPIMTVDNTQATENKDRPMKGDQDQSKVMKDDEKIK